MQWFDIIDNTSQAPYTKLTSFPYPKVGTENATARIGVLHLKELGVEKSRDAMTQSAKTTWLDLAPSGGEDHYLASLDWLGSQTVAVQRLPREQSKVEILLCDVHSGASKVVFTETEDTWIGKPRRIQLPRIYDNTMTTGLLQIQLTIIVLMEGG